jgi:hypothetical protein
MSSGLDAGLVSRVSQEGKGTAENSIVHGCAVHVAANDDPTDGRLVPNNAAVNIETIHVSTTGLSSIDHRTINIGANDLLRRTVQLSPPSFSQLSYIFVDNSLNLLFARSGFCVS